MIATKSLGKLPLDATMYTDAGLEGWDGASKNLTKEACSLSKSKN